MEDDRQADPEAGRTRWEWLTWQAAAAAIAALMLGVVLGGSETPTTEPVAAPEPAETVTVTARPEPAETVTVTAAPAPTADPTSSTTTAERFRLGLLATMEDPSDIVSALREMNPHVETVDKLVLYPDPYELHLDITSGWSAADNQREAAWLIARSTAALYDTGNMASPFVDDDIAVAFPTLRLTVSGHRYVCDPTTMVELGRTRLGRSEWEAACAP